MQRSRLADRMRPPWWYLSGIAILYALIFAAPFSQRFLPQGVHTWPILVAAVAVACLLQWGLARATGIAVNTRMLRCPSGRPAGIAMIVVGIAAFGTEAFLIRRGLLVAGRGRPAAAHVVPAHRGRPPGGARSSGLAGPAGGGGLGQHPGCAPGEAPPW